MARLKSVMDYSLLEEITPTNKDSKAFFPAIITFFQNLEGKFLEMLDSMKTDFRKTLQEKDEKIEGLEKEVTNMKKQLALMEERVEDNDSYERRDTLIFSGPAIPPANPNERCTDLILDTLRTKLNVNMAKENISIAHRHGKDKKSLIVKFCQGSSKLDILSSLKSVRPPNLFISESLTPQRQTIAYVLRRAKREYPDVVAGSNTIEGKNYVWVKPPNPNAPGARNLKINVSSYARLQDFCSRSLEVPVTHFVKDWKF